MILIIDEKLKNLQKKNKKKIIMKKIFLTIAIFIGISGFCFSQEEENEMEKPKDYTLAIHIHPLTLINSVLTYKENSSHYIYTTIEIPYSPSTSFMVRPSIWYVETRRCFSLLGSGSCNKNLYRVGTDSGIRYYPPNKQEFKQKFYVQGTVGIFRRKYEEYDDYDYANWYQRYGLTSDSESFFEADIMMYIGGLVKLKTNLSILADIGIGVGTHPGRVFTADDGLLRELNGSNFRFDWNFV